jgi:hypothetical protein
MHCCQWVADLMVNAMELIFGTGTRCLYGLFLTLFFAGFGGEAALAQTPLLPPPSVPESAFEHCRTIADDAARLRCYEGATSQPPAAAPSQSPAAATPLPPAVAPPQASSTGAGNWRLVRTPNPAGGPDAVSITQTADITKSDLDLAGLMLRCGQTGVEVLVVLVEPLPPRAHPKVSVSTGGAALDLPATVVPPGALILLPQDASVLANGPWQNAAELTIDVEDSSERVKGVVPVAGLSSALPKLMANCAAH